MEGPRDIGSHTPEDAAAFEAWHSGWDGEDGDGHVSDHEERDLETEEPDMCSHCNGTGMAMHGPPDVGSCSACRGSGLL